MKTPQINIKREQSEELANRLLRAMDGNERIKKYVSNRLCKYKPGRRWQKQRRAWHGVIVNAVESYLDSKNFRKSIAELLPK